VYKCPYCSKNNFNNWKSVRAHVSTCKINNSEFFIDEIVGPIHYTDISLNKENFHNKYKNCKTSIYQIYKIFLKKKIPVSLIKERKFYSKEDCIFYIKEFVYLYNKIPQKRDFEHTKYSEKPHFTTFMKLFGSWNNAIIASGFEPNLNDGLGCRTTAKDGILYRSKLEAYFVDNYLYNKYKYIVEPEYPNSHKLYDFYLPELDLYIELSGGLRPEVLEEKKLINQKLNRKCLFLNSDEVYDNKILIS
jgi:hypothetical protein